MKICFFGTYEKKYPLNSILLKGLKKNGFDIKECHVPVWEKHRNKYGKFLNAGPLIFFSIKVIFAYIKLGFRYLSKHKNADLVIIGYIGQFDIIFFKCLSFFVKKKPKIIFVPLVSLFDTVVVDRESASNGKLFSKVLFYLDKISFKLADIIIFDTFEHIKYISNLFNLEKKKFRRVWVGADEDIFYPVEKKTGNGRTFTVLFFGKYIPLHGLEYIIEAARLLINHKDIKFRMIGSGQLYGKITCLARESGADNIEFKEWVEQDELVNEIAKADVVLGIFGGTEKSLRVIPNKVFQAIACRKPVITGESNAMVELFENRKNIYFSKNQNAQSLKNAILDIKDSRDLGKNIAEGGYSLFKSNADSFHIGKLFVENIQV